MFDIYSLHSAVEICFCASSSDDMQCLRKDCHFRMSHQIASPSCTPCSPLLYLHSLHIGHSWKSSPVASALPTSISKRPEITESSQSAIASASAAVVPTPPTLAQVLPRGEPVSSSGLSCPSVPTPPQTECGSTQQFAPDQKPFVGILSDSHEATNTSGQPLAPDQKPFVDFSSGLHEGINKPAQIVPLAISTISPPTTECSQSHARDPSHNGPWSVADQLEQYANHARGLRDWSRQSDESPHILSPIGLMIPGNSFPPPVMNNFLSPPLFPPFPECFQSSQPASLPPQSAPPTFLAPDSTDASFPAVPLPSSSRPIPHLSRVFNEPPPFPFTPGPPPSVSHASIADCSDHLRLSPSVTSRGTSSQRDEMRTKSGKPRNPANPNNLLVPPLVNDLLLGVKKAGQKQVQSDLEQLMRDDADGHRSEKLGKSRYYFLTAQT